MKFLQVLLFLFFTVSIGSQVVNIESRRMRSDSLGWAGVAEANFLFSKNVEVIYDFGAALHFQYKGKNDLWLFLNEYRHIEGAGTKFVNSGFAHIRYNRKITKELLRWEVFTQVQFNGVLDVRLRALAGTGPRFKLYDSETFRMYAASLYMFEYQENISRTIIERNHRLSSYLSVSVGTDKVKLSNTTYYQPNFKSISDYRIYSQTDLLIGIFEQLSFKSGFTYRYDSRPFPKIPRETYFLNNGIVFEF